jgi:acyl carrier protein
VSDVERTIREVLETHGRLPVPVESLQETDDLFDNGLTSHASVNVMLALEDAYDFEFPDELLVKSTFESISAIQSALNSLGVTAASN